MCNSAKQPIEMLCFTLIVYTMAISSVNKFAINEWLRLNNFRFLMCGLQAHCSWSSCVCLCCYCVLVCTYTSMLRTSSSFGALLHPCWGCQEKNILTVRLHLQQCCEFLWCRLSQDHILWVLISTDTHDLKSVRVHPMWDFCGQCNLNMLAP